MSDSRPETYEHIGHVRELLLLVACDLIRRAHAHDASKLRPPELEAFDRQAGTLKTIRYDSDEYRAALAELKPALDHHYAVNDHHPQHWKDGIEEMGLVTLTEMLCDWMAAARRSVDGDVGRSITLNAARFGYGPELERILRNTLEEIVRLQDERGLE